jgi:hypothetical protein
LTFNNDKLKTFMQALATASTALQALEAATMQLLPATFGHPPAPSNPPTTHVDSTKGWQIMLPDELRSDVTITDEGNNYKVKVNRFLQPERFSQLAEIMKQYGGEYISAGKNTHFKVPKTGGDSFQ